VVRNPSPRQPESGQEHQAHREHHPPRDPGTPPEKPDPCPIDVVNRRPGQVTGEITGRTGRPGRGSRTRIRVIPARLQARRSGDRHPRGLQDRRVRCPDLRRLERHVRICLAWGRVVMKTTHTLPTKHPEIASSFQITFDNRESGELGHEIELARRSAGRHAHGESVGPRSVRKDEEPMHHICHTTIGPVRVTTRSQAR
jgi:hypothetical protein